MRVENENYSGMSPSFPKHLIYAAVGSIGLTFIVNAQLEVSINHAPHYDRAKVFTGIALMAGSVLAYTVEKIYNRCCTKQI